MKVTIFMRFLIKALRFFGINFKISIDHPLPGHRAEAGILIDKKDRITFLFDRVFEMMPSVPMRFQSPCAKEDTAVKHNARNRVFSSVYF